MAPPRLPTLPVNSDFGPYHLLRILGAGGMAEVYLARTKGVAGFERLLALKVISPAYAEDPRVVQMLVAEARLAIGLNHPNIAQTFDLGRIGDVFFITMEYVDGIDYFKLLKGITDQDAEVPMGLALYVAREVCLGLDYAHRRTDAQGAPMRIIHRDVSPQNVLLSRQGAVKLVDFGIAKATNVAGDTRAGTLKGKLVYMSPEQARGEPVDQRSDIFSAGIVLYESLTGGPLYPEQNPISLLKLVRKAEILPPSSRNGDIPVELDALVMRALAPRRENRYQSALELADAIARYMQQAGIEHSAAQLGGMVTAILDGEPFDDGPDESTSPRWTSGALAGPMDRADYAAQGHSLILSAAALQQGQSPPGARPAARLILHGEAGDETHELGEEFVIGRGGDLRLLNARVSRRHARITWAGGAYLLEDLNSSNGTFLNDEKLSAARALQSGDAIRIGPFGLDFVVEPARPAASVPDVIAPIPEAAAAVAAPPAAARAAGAREAPGVASGDRTGPEGTGVLVIEAHGQQEQLVIALEHTLLLEQRIGVDRLSLGGPAGRLRCQSDGYWLEPVAGREPLLHNGQPLRAAVRLDEGDSIAIGPLSARFRAR